MLVALFKVTYSTCNYYPGQRFSWHNPTDAISVGHPIDYKQGRRVARQPGCNRTTQLSNPVIPIRSVIVTGKGNQFANQSSTRRSVDENRPEYGLMRSCELSSKACLTAARDSMDYDGRNLQRRARPQKLVWLVEEICPANELGVGFPAMLSCVRQGSSCEAIVDREQFVKELTCRQKATHEAYMAPVSSDRKRSGNGWLRTCLGFRDIGASFGDPVHQCPVTFLGVERRTQPVLLQKVCCPAYTNVRNFFATGQRILRNPQSSEERFHVYRRRAELGS